MNGRVSRRRFLKSTAIATAFTVIPSGLVRGYSANEKLNIGIIGAGGRGAANTRGVSSENIVALCDVDENRLNAQAAKYPKARKYFDFREMLEKEKNLDAVVVSTPDHTHAIASIMAMKLGLHVYCEKPLTHDVYEARQMAKIAEEKKLITHMGTGAQSSEGAIRTVEAIRAGHIGEIVEAHCWTNRPIWPQGMNRPKGEDPVPPYLKWDLWIGTAPMRPFKATWPEDSPVVKKWRKRQVYHPFVWRGWWDFGTGALGDIAPHIMNIVFWALELGAPKTVEVVECSGMMPEAFPEWSVIRFDFPARGKHPPLKLFWYDGGKLPPKDLFEGGKVPANGTLFVGTKGRIKPGGKPYPSKDFADYQFPEPTLPRREEIHREWVKCVKTGKQPGCPFSYSGPMTEAYLLGNIALKVGRKIEWDPVAFRITNCEEANKYLRREYRKGWEI